MNKYISQIEEKIAAALKLGSPGLDLSGGWTTSDRAALPYLPEKLRDLAHLKWLDLSRNRLGELPDWLGDFNQLTSLKVADNDLTVLPESFAHLINLESLDVSGNKMDSLPDWFSRLDKLNSVDLSRNELSTVPKLLCELREIEQLELWMNNLHDLPPWLSRLSKLRRLSISSNRFASLPECVCDLRNLTHLYATANQIHSLPSSIGRLSKLMVLVLGGTMLSWNARIGPGEHGNRLTSLPRELGQLNSLTTLEVEDNPLPIEILRLQKDGLLIGYLRALAAHQGRPESAPPCPFDEAKLLLVGPGEVGKTWLLQALQGKIPKRKGSTKGLEISREPLKLPHPTDASRAIHLNCWDFGGQDNYQITHQIFFSPKAIYLLVWKPRPGVDPDLVVRLERIQLSAGQSAKVFIISTHADGSIPAVIGHDAIRERFGNLIQGFFSVDSGRGTQGTGIAELKIEIAKAASQLDGMDTPFPAEWHWAQKAVAARRRPTLTFSEFVEVCVERGMSAESCESLASIMDVLGNAVFFGDASKSGEAGVAEGDNLVVLDPEWLAKAVAFVIEDAETRKNSGVLAHKHLRDIWKKDAHRGCPGYRKNLYGYLLWMMWKFDIAYKQNDQTSLLPELIHRNRPDDLRWTPATPSVERQATLICRVPKDPPAGLIPVLTAAAHPLRRVQNPGEESDRLDRNWRDGFFLDTARRGTAFVELLDRDLRITVRDSYPSDLSRQIRRTLERVAQDRWPRLDLDYRVPCIGRIDEKRPCPGTFKWEYLEKRRGKVVPCQHCNCDEIEVEKMLEGFDADSEAIFRRLNQLKDGQADLMAAALRIFRDALDPARGELERAPCMFTILPAKPGGWDLLAKATEVRVRVTCWCEHPDGPHPAVQIGTGEAPEYVLRAPRDWLLKAGPYISWAAMLFKAFVPLAGAVLRQSMEEILPIDLKAQIDIMGEASKAIPTGKLDVGRSDDLGFVHRSRPEIVALRHIHDALLAQVPEQKRWGSLRPVRAKSGDLLWLCPEHAALQQPPVQMI